MTKSIKILMAVMLAAVLTSCAALRPVDFSKISLGMSKAEVQAALRKKPDNIVAARHFTDPEATVEVLQYSESTVTSYYLYFVNDKLDKWNQALPDGRKPDLSYYNR